MDSMGSEGPHVEHDRRQRRQGLLHDLGLQERDVEDVIRACTAAAPSLHFWVVGPNHIEQVRTFRSISRMAALKRLQGDLTVVAEWLGADLLQSLELHITTQHHTSDRLMMLSHNLDSALLHSTWAVAHLRIARPARTSSR